VKPLGGLPRITLELGGISVRPEALLSVRVQQRLSLPSLCELAVSDPDGTLSRGGPTVGGSFRVRIGEAAEPLFEGDLTAVEYVSGASRQREVRLRGYDLLHRLRKSQPVRAHVDVNAADLARELAGPIGLEVNASASGPVWPFLVQWRQSDLELLADVAARAGLFLTLRGNVLHLLTLEGMGDPLPLVAGENLPECSVEVNSDRACRKVEATGWDLASVVEREGQATTPRLGRSVQAEAPPSSVGGTGVRTLAGALAPSADHAEAAAQAELDRRAGAEVILRGVAEGDPGLRPGARVVLRGMPESVSGTHVLTAVTHTIDPRRGFLSEISTEPPEPAQPSSAASFATVGEVSRIDGGTGRVKVALAAFGGVETDWMQVASPGAGKKKGLAMVPDAGDRVLVLCSHGDPGQGVVVGGLYGADGPEDTGVEGGSVRRFTLRTAAGHVIRLDDGKQVLRVEDPTGSYLEMAPGRVRLHSAVSLEIEAPGQPVVIRGRTVDFQRG
jgi:phage baseplate assembly protein V